MSATQLKCDKCNQGCVWNNPKLFIKVKFDHRRNHNGCGISCVKCCLGGGIGGQLGYFENNLLIQRIYINYDIQDMILRYNNDNMANFSPRIDRNAKNNPSNDSNSNEMETDNNNSNNDKMVDSRNDHNSNSNEMERDNNNNRNYDNDEKSMERNDNSNNNNNYDDDIDIETNRNCSPGVKEPTPVPDGMVKCYICERILDPEEIYDEYGECLECWGKNKRLVDNNGRIRCKKNGNLIPRCDHNHKMKGYDSCEECNRIKKQRAMNRGELF